MISQAMKKKDQHQHDAIRGGESKRPTPTSVQGGSITKITNKSLLRGKHLKDWHQQN